MRRLLVAALVLAACGQAVRTPAPELVVPTGPEPAGYSFVRTTTGQKPAELAPGNLSYGLSGGGDLAEAA